jgi:hypothetical protein
LSHLMPYLPAMALAQELCLGVFPDDSARPGDPDELRPDVERLLEIVDAVHPLPEGAPPFRVLASRGGSGFSCARDGDPFTVTGSSYRRTGWPDVAYWFSGYIPWHGGLDITLAREAIQKTAGFAELVERQSHRDLAGLVSDLWHNAYAQWLVLKSGEKAAQEAWLERNRVHYDPWEWDDFAPVAQALDESVARVRLAATTVLPARRSRLSALAAERLSPAL